MWEGMLRCNYVTAKGARALQYRAQERLLHRHKGLSLMGLNMSQSRVIWTPLLFACLMYAISFHAGAVDNIEMADAAAKNSIIEKLRALDDLDASDYGIRHNCIKNSRIRSIRFEDDQTAIVDVGRSRQVILTLRKKCPGIKQRPYIHRSRLDSLCARYDRFEILESGLQCQVETLEPYMRLENDAR